MKCIEVIALKKIDIIYEDKYLIIVNKPSGIFSISTLKEKEKTMYHEVYEYSRKKNQRVFIVHRLDKDTSGLMLFAKNVDVKNYFQDNWDKVTRKYVAVVEGVVKEDSKTIKNYLKENKNFVTYSDPNGKLAITKYKKIRSYKIILVLVYLLLCFPFFLIIKNFVKTPNYMVLLNVWEAVYVIPLFLYVMVIFAKKFIILYSRKKVFITKSI